MMRQFSQAARERLLEPWEEFVGYVYDDKVGKEHIDGRLQYPEWNGGPVRGTLTIGFGHTDAAGAPKITLGMRITREQADQILDEDLRPCVAEVNRLLKVEVTQHQFDALVDTDFNCPSAAVAAIKLVNAGDSRAVPAKILQYVHSRGEYMQGLVNRRNAEIAWFNHPDDVEPPPAPQPEIVFSPKAERNPPPTTLVKTKTAAAAGTVVLSGVAGAAQQMNEALEPIKQAKGSLAELGVLEHLTPLVHSQMGLVSIAVIGLGLFILADRYVKLVNDHV